MSKQRLKAAFALALMAMSFAAAHELTPTVHMADVRGRLELTEIFPKRIGEWVADDNVGVLLVSPVLQAVIDKIYNQTLSRTYVNPRGERIMLSVAYGGDQSDATRVHRPEVCYPAQGFQIVGSGTGVVAASGRDIKVRRLVARAGGRVEPITYWVITGSEISLTGTEQKLTQLKYTLNGVIPDGMLVRVSNISGDSQAAYQLQDRFIAELSAALPAASRDRVIGTMPSSAS